MLKIYVLTLFPNLFNEFLNTSIIKNNIKKKIVKVELIDFRNFAEGKRKNVDNYQYGGGGGMVLMLPPIIKCLESLNYKKKHVILLTPQSTPFIQEEANKLINLKKDLIFICGRYEGFDERILNYVDQTISIGDYVLNGGELPCMVVLEAITRLIDGSINNDSLKSESYNNNLLDYPTYTTPLSFDNHNVPDVLLSGDHKKINKYRLEQQINKTKNIRPDLYKKYLKKK